MGMQSKTEHVLDAYRLQTTHTFAITQWSRLDDLDAHSSQTRDTFLYAVAKLASDSGNFYASSYDNSAGPNK